MEVKSIFVNLIMRNYEKQDLSISKENHQGVAEKEPARDEVSISPHANERLFGELMEHSLKKGLSEVCEDEN